MTKQDLIGVKDVHSNRMFFDPASSKVVCKKHNTELYGGTLQPRNFTRGARCWYCSNPGEKP